MASVDLPHPQRHSAPHPLLPCAFQEPWEVVEGTHRITAEGTGVEPYTPLASSSETGLAGYEAHEWAVAPPRCDAIVAPRARPCSAQGASCRIGPLGRWSSTGGMCDPSFG